jgi:hypothetical protein
MGPTTMMRSGKLLVKRPVTPMRLAACEVVTLLVVLQNMKVYGKMIGYR